MAAHDVDVIQRGYDTARGHITKAAVALTNLPPTEDLGQVISDLQGIDDTIAFLLSEYLAAGD